eukprot:282045_1
MSCNCELLICNCNKTDNKANHITLKKLPWDYKYTHTNPIYWQHQSKQYIIFPNHHNIWVYDINNDNYIKKTCPSEYAYSHFYCIINHKQNKLYCIGKENYFSTFDLIHNEWSTICNGFNKDKLKSINMNFPALANICHTLSVKSSTINSNDQLYVFSIGNNKTLMQYKYDINKQIFINLANNSFGKMWCMRMLIYMEELKQFVLVVSCYEKRQFLDNQSCHISFDHIYISNSAESFQWIHTFQFPIQNKTGPYANWMETNVLYMHYETFILMFQCNENILWCFDLQKNKLFKIGNDNHEMQLLKNTQFIVNPLTKYMHYLDGNSHKKTHLSNLVVSLFSEVLVFGYVKEINKKDKLFVEIPTYLTQLIVSYFSDLTARSLSK